MNEAAIQATSEICSSLQPQGLLRGRFLSSDGEHLETKILRIANRLNFHDRAQVAVLLGQLLSVPAHQGKVVAKSLRQLTQEAKERLLEALRKMEAGDCYQRYFSLYTCYGSKDAKRVLRSVSDRSAMIRRLALAILPNVISEDEISDALLGMKEAERRSVLKRLRVLRHETVIDKFLLELRSLDRDAYVRLFPYGSRSFIEGDWKHLQEDLSAAHWERLARNHPEFCLERLERIFSDADKHDPKLLRLANTVLPVTGRLQLDGNMRILERVTDGFPLGKINLGKLTRLRSRELSEILLRKESSASFDLSSVYPKLGVKTTSLLLAKMPLSHRQVSTWLKKFRPEERSRLFAEFKERWRSSEGLFEVALLRQLPTGPRVAEARQMLKSPVLLPRPEQRLPYAELLPWAECRTEVESYVNDPAPDLRMLGISVLLRALRFHGESVTEALQLVKSRKHEQDPVRLAMLNELVTLPPSIWKEEHRDALSAIFRDALDAKDLSSGSVQAILRFLVRLLDFHPEWAAKQFAGIIEERGYPARLWYRGGLEERHVKLLLHASLRVLKKWQTKEKERYLICFAGELGRYVKDFPEIRSVLASLARGASEVSVSEAALNILQTTKCPEFEALVEDLLRSDPTWSSKYSIIGFLHARRQDLLTPYLGQKAYSGKFGTGKTRRVPSFSGGFERWTAVQKQIYQEALESMLTQKGNDTGDSFFALSSLSRLPDPPLNVFIRYSTLDPAKHSAVRDQAITCLANLDGGEGVPELIQCLTDERARVAIYSLRRAILEMTPKTALKLLADVPSGKITVLKEVIRLSGELRTPDALAFLLRTAAGEHGVDVRTSLLRSLWDYLERPETWDYFENQALLGERPIALHLARIPSFNVSNRALERLSRLLGILLEHPEPKVRVEILKRLIAQPVTDSALSLKSKLSNSLCARLRDESNTAALAIVHTYGRQVPETIASILASVRENRRALSSLLSAFTSELRQDRKRLNGAGRSIVSALDGDPNLTSQRLSLSVLVITAEEIINLVERIRENHLLHPGSLSGLVQSLPMFLVREDAEEANAFVKRWCASPHPDLRRLALAALTANCESRTGWSEADLALLEQFRMDSAPLVAEAAQFTFPAKELES